MERYKTHAAKIPKASLHPPNILSSLADAPPVCAVTGYVRVGDPTTTLVDLGVMVMLSIRGGGMIAIREVVGAGGKATAKVEFDCMMMIGD